jgi:hypothetical protein
MEGLALEAARLCFSPFLACCAFELLRTFSLPPNPSSLQFEK